MGGVKTLTGGDVTVVANLGGVTVGPGPTLVGVTLGGGCVREFIVSTLFYSEESILMTF